MIEAISQLGLKLKAVNVPWVAARAQLRIGDNSQYGRFVWRQAVADIELNRFQNRMPDLFPLNPNGFHTLWGQSVCDGCVIQTQRVIDCASLYHEQEHCKSQSSCLHC